MDTTTTRTQRPERAPRAPEPPAPALVLVWSPPPLDRLGEALLPGPSWSVVGRDLQTLSLCQQRPGHAQPTGPIRSRRWSREQLRVRAVGNALEVENIGRRTLRVDGVETDCATVRPGSLVEVAGTLFLTVLRPPVLDSPPPGVELSHHAFGGADADGILGESPAAWALRGAIGFLAGRDSHVLVHGPSGAGKELVARALHTHSHRRSQPFVGRSAATLPEGLADAELFGHVAGYPNAGMPERRGLVGQADRGTLFLDEIGEVAASLQAHLLRVLDAGEYHRLGDPRSHRVDLRMIAATNRSPDALKHDLAERLVLRIAVPSLASRREDVPLLLRHVLGEIAAGDAAIRARFFEGDAPRVQIDDVASLIRRDWTGNVRELRRLVWHAVGNSPGDTLVFPAQASDPSPEPTSEAQRIQEVLDRHNGNQTAASEELGLSSRYVLRRLIKKHGLVVRRTT